MDGPEQPVMNEPPSIASRFESQKTIDAAKAMQEKEWKEAYARLGQEPPPREEEVIHDGRTLYEKLQTNKDLKREEWDNKMKLSNQYRGLDSEEMAFLADKARERKEEETRKEKEEDAEIREYRSKLAARNAVSLAASEPSSSRPSQTTTAEPSRPKVPVKPPKKDVKSLLKGVVVKKKPVGSGNTNGTAKTSSAAIAIPQRMPLTGTTTSVRAPVNADGVEIERRSTDSGVGSKRPMDDEPVVDTGEEGKKPRME